MADVAPVTNTAVDVRAAARHRADTLGLPTSALEDWRYVRCDTLRTGGYAAPRAVSTAELRALVDPSQRALVLVDGRFHSLGHGDWPAGWKPTLSSAADDHALSDELANEKDVAACWAVADGECRQVLRVVASHPEPLHLVSIATGGTSGWTVTIDVAAGATLDVVLRHVQLGAARSCPALTIRLGRGARVRVSEFQVGAWHHLLSSHRVTINADAVAEWTAVADGGACVRLATRVELAGRGAHAALAGVTQVRGADQAHLLTRLDHAVGPTTSDQLFKAIVHDAAATSFDGRVLIRVGADGANAELQNRNLLLSDKARADTRPQLDIKADDVKAAHGATVGQLDADELLYLRMRGITLAEARSLLTAGFVGEVLARLAHPEFLP